MDGCIKLCGAGRGNTIEWRSTGIFVKDIRGNIWIPVHMVCCHCIETRIKRYHIDNYGGILGQGSDRGRGRECESVDQQVYGVDRVVLGDVSQLHIYQIGYEIGRHVHVL